MLIGVASSGVHSNGFSLVRKVIEKTGLPWEAPSPFVSGQSLGDAILTPTRIYVKACIAVIRETKAIKAWPISPAADFQTTFRGFCQKDWAHGSI